MTILKCSATKCLYNENELCSRGDIEITGDNAHRADETNCGSFRDRATAGMTNSKAHHCGCEKINIDCKAQECPITISANVRLLPLMWSDAAQTDVTKQNVIPSPANADPYAQKDAASNSVFFMSESFSF